MPFKSLVDIEIIERMPLASRGLPSSTYAALQQAALRSPDRPALRFFLDAANFTETHDWTFHEFFADVTRTANALHRLGIGPDDVVAFVLPNLPETHFTIWGGETAGIVMAINPLFEAAQIGDLLRASNAKAVVTLAPTPGTDLWSKVSRQLSSLPSVSDILWVSMAPYVSEAQAAGLRQLAALEKSTQASVRIHDFRQLLHEQSATDLVSGRWIASTDPSSYFCTGGTTGLPKIAVRTHGCEVFDAWAMAQNVDDGKLDRVYFCGLPLFHVNGQLVTGLLPWMLDACVVLGTPQGYRGAGLVDRFWEIVSHFRISFFSGVPTVFAALIAKPVAGIDLSSLEYAICGAAPMPVELFRNFEQVCSIRILEGYGLTEAACCSSVNPATGERRIGSVGLRLPYQQLRIVFLDETGAFIGPAPVDEVGVILVHGPNVFAGYLEELHNRDVWVEIDGLRWLNTGDLGRQDAQGYFWLTGRKKDLIIRGGHNIDPKQIEEALERHPDVTIAAAIGSPDAYAGEVPVAYVQLVPGTHRDETELMEFAKTVINERAAIPKRITVVDALPVTAVGKIYKPALQMIEIGIVVRNEASNLGLADVEVNVVQDTRRGLVAKIYAPQDGERLAAALGRYTFHIEWDQPSTLATTPERRDQQ